MQPERSSPLRCNGWAISPPLGSYGDRPGGLVGEGRDSQGRSAARQAGSREQASGSEAACRVQVFPLPADLWARSYSFSKAAADWQQPISKTRQVFSRIPRSMNIASSLLSAAN